jgi:hypothetical protein
MSAYPEPDMSGADIDDTRVSCADMLDDLHEVAGLLDPFHSRQVERLPVVDLVEVDMECDFTVLIAEVPDDEEGSWCFWAGIGADFEGIVVDG